MFDIENIARHPKQTLGRLGAIAWPKGDPTHRHKYMCLALISRCVILCETRVNAYICKEVSHFNSYDISAK